MNENVTTEQAPSRESILDMAKNVDLNNDIDVNIPETNPNDTIETKAETPKPAEKAKKLSSFSKGTEKTNTEIGAETPKSQKSEQATEVKEGQSPFTLDDILKHDKFDKTEGRFHRSWENLHKLQTQFTQSKQAWEKEKSEYEKQVTDRFFTRPDVVKMTPEVYETLAKQALENGDEQSAEEYRKLARELPEKLQDWEKQHQKYKQDMLQHQESVRNHKAKVWNDLQVEYPDMLEAGSPINQKLSALYAKREDGKTFQNPGLVQFFNTDPNGDWYAVKLAEMMVKADSFSVLEKKVQELEGKLAQANKKLSPLTSSASQPKQQKSLEGMPLHEARTAVLEAAKLADAEAF